MARFVTVASYDESFRADVARSALEDVGIEVRIADREIVAMEWILSTAVGGIKVQVAEADVLRAREVLDEALRELREGGIDEDELARQALEAAPEEDVPPPPLVEIQQLVATMDRTEANVTAGEREEYARRFLLASVFSLLLPLLGPYSIYLFLNASLGTGRLSSEGWRRLLYGLLAGVMAFPIWYLILSWGLWGVLSSVLFDW